MDSGVKKEWLLQILVSILATLLGMIILLYVKGMEKDFAQIKESQTILFSKVEDAVREIKYGVKELASSDLQNQVGLAELKQRVKQLESDKAFFKGPPATSSPY